MRQRIRREWGGNRRRGDASLHGNRREWAAALRSSGEEFRQPCGDWSEGKEGERQRGRGLFIEARKEGFDGIINGF
jgi:hypothetical protein